MTPETSEAKPNGEVLIRPARPSEARQLARMVMELITWGRLRHLGLPFNTLLQRFHITSRYGIILVAEVDGRIVGNTGGVTDRKRFYRELAWKWGWLSALLILPYLFKPANLEVLRKGMTYFTKTPVDDPPAEATLMNVIPEYQRGGLGPKLFFALMDEYRKRGFKIVKVGHVNPEKPDVVRYWEEKVGLRYLRTEKFYKDTEVRVYVYDLV